MIIGPVIRRSPERSLRIHATVREAVVTAPSARTNLARTMNLPAGGIAHTSARLSAVALASLKP